MTDELDNNVAVRRRAAIEKALNRAQSHGIQVDTDPRFAELLENWAEGRMTIKQARDAYLEHIRERDQARADWRALGIASSTAKVRASLARKRSEE